MWQATDWQMIAMCSGGESACPLSFGWKSLAPVGPGRVESRAVNSSPATEAQSLFVLYHEEEDHR
jgi:hypothetical protein